MKLCDFTLKQWIERRNHNDSNSLNIELIDDNINLNIFRQILDGVNYIHAKGIIHRDLKVLKIFFDVLICFHVVFK